MRTFEDMYRKEDIGLQYEIMGETKLVASPSEYEKLKKQGWRVVEKIYAPGLTRSFVWRMRSPDEPRPEEITPLPKPKPLNSKWDEQDKETLIRYWLYLQKDKKMLQRLRDLLVRGKPGEYIPPKYLEPSPKWDELDKETLVRYWLYLQKDKEMLQRLRDLLVRGKPGEYIPPKYLEPSPKWDERDKETLIRYWLYLQKDKEMLQRLMNLFALPKPPITPTPPVTPTPPLPIPPEEIPKPIPPPVTPKPPVIPPPVGIPPPLPEGGKIVGEATKEELEKQGWKVIKIMHYYVHDKKMYNYLMIPPPITPTPLYIPPTPEDTKCFIATAAYGTPFAKEIDILRAFRDNSLEPKLIGKKLVNTYYKISPPIANFISRREKLRAITRLLLNPIVRAFKRGE